MPVLKDNFTHMPIFYEGRCLHLASSVSMKILLVVGGQMRLNHHGRPCLMLTRLPPLVNQNGVIMMILMLWGVVVVVMIMMMMMMVG